nr:hypothetical protein CFP56_33265 [Quercus suber]
MPLIPQSTSLVSKDDRANADNLLTENGISSPPFFENSHRSNKCSSVPFFQCLAVSCFRLMAAYSGGGV